MNDTATQPTLHYHLLLDPQEVPIAEQALRLLISDEAHQDEIRSLARTVIGKLKTTPRSQSGTLEVPLSEPEMKITHTAVKLLLDDTQRQQESERTLLRSILDKLPDKHVMRAIELL